MKYTYVYLVALALAACVHPPPSPVPPDADAAPAPIPTAPEAGPAPTDCARACNALILANCPEGSRSTCVETFTKMDHDRTKRVPCEAAVCPALTCALLATVRSASDARALGVTCGATP